MTKPEVVAIALSSAACAAGLFAWSGSQRSAERFAAFEQKLAKLESPPAVPAGLSNADLARELSAARAQLAALSSRPVSGTASAPAKPPPAFQRPGTGTGMTKEEAAKRQQVILDGMTNRIMIALADKVGLTEQQSSQVREIVAKQFVDWLDAQKSVKLGEMTQATEAILRDTNVKIKACLTPEQQEKYDMATNGPTGVFGANGSAEPLNPPVRPETPR